MITYKFNHCGSLDMYIDGVLVGHALPNDPEFMAWVEAGGVAEPYIPPSLSTSECLDATQVRLDALAKAWGYDSMLSLVSYYDSLVPRFAAEAIAGRDFRDATWSAVVALQEQLVAGTIPMPSTIEAYFELLPALPERPVV